MNWALTEEHVALQERVREFAAGTLLQRIKAPGGSDAFDPSVLSLMAEERLLGLCIPVRYGGVGFDYLSLGLACEELEYVDTSFRSVVTANTAVYGLPLFQWGTEEQKQKYLVPCASGRRIGTYAMTEPAAGSDVLNIQSTARKDGDDWILNGKKTWVWLADVADSVIAIVWTDEEKRQRRDHSGLTAFVVERAFPGVDAGQMDGRLISRAGSLGWLTMHDVRVPAQNVLGREGEGFRVAMSGVDIGRFSVAWGATGLIRACRDASVRYAKSRCSAGAPIGKLQLVQQMIAKMQLRLDTSRLLCMQAGWMKNNGIRNTRETAMAKWHASVSALESAEDAVEIHGSNGLLPEYDVERFLRNAKGEVVYEGGSREIHQLIQAQYALGYREDKPLRCELPAYDSEEWHKGA
jgi:glutaryl-CoA dehydrogenase (non-decarboxylating)